MTDAALRATMTPLVADVQRFVHMTGLIQVGRVAEAREIFEREADNNGFIARMGGAASMALQGLDATPSFGWFSPGELAAGQKTEWFAASPDTIYVLRLVTDCTVNSAAGSGSEPVWGSVGDTPEAAARFYRNEEITTQGAGACPPIRARAGQYYATKHLAARAQLMRASASAVTP